MTCSRCRYTLLFACSKKYYWRLKQLSMSLCEAECHVTITFPNFILFVLSRKLLDIRV